MHKSKNKIFFAWFLLLIHCMLNSWCIFILWNLIEWVLHNCHWIKDFIKGIYLFIKKDNLFVMLRSFFQTLMSHTMHVVSLESPWWLRVGIQNELVIKLWWKQIEENAAHTFARKPFTLVTKGSYIVMVGGRELVQQTIPSSIYICLATCDKYEVSKDFTKP
jgi:hypothetical protein